MFGGAKKPKILVWFAEVGKGDIPLVGGKGANLGEMTQAGLPVPQGFIVTAEAYFDFLKANKLDQLVRKTLAGLDAEKTKDLNEAATLLQKAIQTHPLPKALVESIEKAYEEMHQGAVAVRSSATAEDLPDASFAGQQATFLNIEGNQQLIKAIRECWASLFEARAIYYRIANNFDHFKVGIAVPVQKMVESEISGIMFTADPVNSDLAKIVIDAGLGLGEAIVSGSVTPDHYVVDKAGLKILSKEVSQQEWQIVRGKDGKNKHISTPKDKLKGQKLTDKQIIQLAELGKKVEAHYAKPQDTEWAFEGGSFFMVQARPITTLKGQKAATDNQEKSPESPGQAISAVDAEVLVSGAGASVGRASGPVKIIHSPREIDKVLAGDVLVTEMTSPDYVPAMKRAVAIVTDTGGRTCFAGQTKILTNVGFIRIDEIETHAERDHLMVPSVDKHSLKLAWKPILAVLKRRAKTIHVGVSQTNRSLASKLEVTANHRFLTFSNRQLVEEKIGNILNNNAGVISITNLPALANKQADDKLGYLLGAIGTDGSIYRTRTHGEIQFIQKDTPAKKAFINRVRSSFSEVFGYEMRPYLKKASSGYLRGRRINGQAMAYRCYNKALAYQFAEQEQALSTTVLESKPSFVRAFVGGALDGDGTYSQNSNRLNFFSTEPHIFEPFITGCLRLGVLPQVTPNREAKNIQLSEGVNEILKECSRLFGQAARVRSGSRLFAASQLISDIVDKVNYKGRIKPYVKGNLYIDAEKLRKYVLPLADESIQEQLKGILDSDLRMLRAKYLGEGSMTDVYNLTVADNHNYVVFTENYTPVVVANSHAAIVSRELGIPCVVGTGTATHNLETGQMVTVDGHDGKVFKGKVGPHSPAVATSTSLTTPISARETMPVTGTKVYLNLAEPEKADEYAQLPVDGVGLLRAEFIIAGIGEHPKAMMASGRAKDYVKKLSQGIGTIAQAFHPRPVVYRATDFKTNEYRSLKGGEKYEEQESNPMIGYRGASRYIADPEEFALELEAIKAVRDGHDLKNLHLMIPVVRRVDEFCKIRDLIHKNGLRQSSDFKLWIMVEVPSTIFEIEKYIAEGIDGISIGSNDLTQLILGIDRDSAKLASQFDERYPAVMTAMTHVIKACRKGHVTSSICGQAPSAYPEVTEALVKAGITSVSVAPDVAISTRKLIASVEKRLLLSQVLDK